MEGSLCIGTNSINYGFSYSFEITYIKSLIKYGFIWMTDTHVQYKNVRNNLNDLN